MTAFDLPLWFVLGFVFVIGCCIGSFLNVCIYRLPLHENVLRAWSGLNSPPSRCPFCLTRILAIDNIPIFGWLKLRGRCRACKHWIPPRYMLIEGLNGLLWVVAYLCIVPIPFHGPLSQSQLYSDLNPLVVTLDRQSAIFHLHMQYLWVMALIEALLVATFIDLDLQIIPDSVTFPGFAAGIVGLLLFPTIFLMPVWYQDPRFLHDLSNLIPVLDGWLPNSHMPQWIVQHPRLHALAVICMGFVVGGGSIWLIRVVGQWALNQEAMGFGDVILMAMIGAFIGWQPVLIVCFLAPLIAIVVSGISALVGKGENEIPYGPHLSLATLLVVLFWRHWDSAIARGVFGTGPFVILVGLALIVPFAILLRLTRMARIALGMMEEFDEPEDEWTSADQLTFFAYKNLDPPPRDQRTELWPGSASSRGTLQCSNWHRGK